MKKDLNQKNREGIANIILLVGIILILMGVVFGVSNILENAGKAFIICGVGTVLTYVSNYLKNGYIKFFN